MFSEIENEIEVDGRFGCVMCSNVCSIYKPQLHIFTIHMDRTHVCFSCRFRYSKANRFSVHRGKREENHTKQTAWV